MLTETTIGALIIERLKLFLPARMKDSVLNLPNKPEQITADVIRTKHPDGLFVCGFSESEGNAGAETQLYAIDCLAQGVERSEALGAFCKLVTTGWQVPGATRFEFHNSVLTAQEAGVVVRRVQFRCSVPAVKVPETRINEEVAKLNL